MWLRPYVSTGFIPWYVESIKFPSVKDTAGGAAAGTAHDAELGARVGPPPAYSKFHLILSRAPI